MAYVYILRSEKNGKYYIGSTSDYKRRLMQHNSGNSIYTRSNRPYEIVFKQKYETLKAAKTVEGRLKKFKSRKILDKIILDRIIKMSS